MVNRYNAGLSVMVILYILFVVVPFLLTGTVILSLAFIFGGGLLIWGFILLIIGILSIIPVILVMGGKGRK